MQAQWDDILERVDEYYDHLDDLAEFCGSVEESREQLENGVNWAKVGKEKRAEVFAEIDKSVTKVQEDIEEAEQEFNQICDDMEEVIYSLSSYKKQNSYFEPSTREIAAERLYEYKMFSETMKARFGFERSEKLRARRTERLKQWE